MRNIIPRGWAASLIMTALLLGLTWVATAQAEDVKQEIEGLKEEISALKDQQSSFVEELGRAIKIGGYGVLEYEKFEGNPNTFDGHKIEFLISGNIHDRVRLYNEIEFEGVSDITNQGSTTATCVLDTNGDGVGDTTGTCVTSVTNTGGSGNIEVEQSYIEFLITRWINVRGGILTVPFGRFNLNHFDPTYDLTDRPLTARRVVPTTWSDVGFGLFGNIKLAEPIDLFYELYVINGLDDGLSTAAGGLRDARPGFRADNNGDKAVVGRLSLDITDQYEIGFSGYTGDYDAASTSRINGFAADIFFHPKAGNFLDRFELQGELDWFDVNGSALTKLWGYYVQINFHFWPRFLDKTFLGKSFNKPTFTMVARAEQVRIDTTADRKETRYTFGLNYRPVEEFVVKTEYQINTSGAAGGIERVGANGFIASLAWLF